MRESYLCSGPLDDRLDGRSFALLFTLGRKCHVCSRQFGRLFLRVDTNDSNIVDHGMGQKESFEIGWCDLESFVLDKFLDPVNDAVGAAKSSNVSPWRFSHYPVFEINSLTK